VNGALRCIGDVVVVLHPPLVPPVHHQPPRVGGPAHRRSPLCSGPHLVRAGIIESVGIELLPIRRETYGVATAVRADVQVVALDERLPRRIGRHDVGHSRWERIRHDAGIAGNVALEPLPSHSEGDRLFPAEKVEGVEGELPAGIGAVVG
jgi:hypothetical protein